MSKIVPSQVVIPKLLRPLKYCGREVHCYPRERMPHLAGVAKGVYFLFYRREVVRVGMSKLSILERVRHYALPSPVRTPTIDFTKVVLLILQDSISDVEEVFIRWLQPRFNHVETGKGMGLFDSHVLAAFGFEDPLPQIVRENVPDETIGIHRTHNYDPGARAIYRKNGCTK